MKKILSLLMMSMLAIGAWAADETVVFSEQGYENSQAIETYAGTDFTVTFNKGTNSNAPKYYTSGTAIRVYGGNYFTVSSSKTIAKIELGFGSSDGTNAITTDVETYTSGTWEGSASAVTFTIGGSTGNRRLASIAVTFDNGIIPNVATPVIAGETPFTESTEVTITCTTTGATIYYTTDGTAPTSASTEYTAPFELTESAIVKAIAYDADNNASSVASKEFVKEEPVVLTNVATVAEFNALADDTEFTFTGNLTVSGQRNSYLYAQDATGGILIYGTAGQTYNKLDVIPAGWTAKKTTFHGAPEAAEPAGLAAATTQADLAPEEITPAQVTLENAFKYAVIRGAIVTMTNNNSGTITVGDETVALYKRFNNVTIPTDGGVYDIIGVTGYYDAPQFMPLEFVPQGVDVATPVISGETPFIGSTMVTITCEEEGVSIHYTIDGTDPTINSTLYTEPFELTESATVKAIAFNEAEDCSAIASMEFVKTTTVATVAEFDALAEGVTFVFTGNLVVSGQAGQRLYAQDETGGVLIYGNAGQTYDFGDVIPAGFGAKKANYNGTIEMSNMTGMQAATETAELVAAEIAIADYATHENVYAVVIGATVDGNTLVIGEETLAIFNRFNVTFPTDDKTYDVYGVTTIYNNAPQLLPLEFVEHVEQTATPVITVEEGDEYYIVTAIGDGEVRLYANNVEVENPYIIMRTTEDQVVVMTATAQEEGKDISETATLEVVVPKIAVVENTITFEAEQEGGTVAVALADGTPVESGVTKVAADTKVTITATPAEGYKLSDIVVKCGDEVIEFDAEETTGRAAETHTFTMPEGEVSIEATFEEETPTAIGNISMENVKSVRYYNVAGVESATPFQGVNIVVREMNDGTKNVTKMVK